MGTKATIQTKKPRFKAASDQKGFGTGLTRRKCYDVYMWTIRSHPLECPNMSPGYAQIPALFILMAYSRAARVPLEVLVDDEAVLP